MNAPKELAYPGELKASELRIWQKRRPRLQNPAVGFGLSGGGIRSATFCLGVFQALSRLPGLLDKIDYISSVSGGGFFAGFYGRLFSRPDITGVKDVSRILSPDENTRLQLREGNPEEAQRNEWKSEVFRWLRENGRYLAPNGSGDLLTGATVFLRNWLTVQLLIASTFLALFLAAQAVRVFWSNADFQTGGLVWWSPFFRLAGAIAFLVVLPLGWAYWTFTDPETGTAQADSGHSYGTRLLNQLKFSFRSFLVLLSLAVSLVAVGSIILPEDVWIITICILELTFVAWQLALLRATASLELSRFLVVTLTVLASLPVVFAALTQSWYLLAASGAILFGLTTFAGLVLPSVQQNQLLNESETARGRLSRWLRTAIVVSAVIASFALLDTAGETLYVLSFTSRFKPSHWVAIILGAVAGITPYARSISVYLTPKKGTRLSPSLSLVAGIAAVVVVLPYLVFLNTLSHAISYEFGKPSDSPVVLTSTGPEQNLTLVKKAPAGSIDPAAASRTKDDDSSKPNVPGTIKPFRKRLAAEFQVPQRVSSGPRRLAPIVYFLILIGLFTFLTGSSASQAAWVFLNRTSLHSLYAARLIRAYLGASNSLRFRPPKPKSGVATTPAGVTDPVDGDDIPQEDYFLMPRAPVKPPGANGKQPPDSAAQGMPEQGRVDVWANGAPMHLINVTVNETIDGRSQTEQRDRKGLGMAVGPAGFSTGVHHHVVFTEETRLQQDGTYAPVKIFPQAGHGYRIFGLDLPPVSGECFRGQRLSLGNWIAISGAAVSTGLGSLTSLGTSVLTAFFNVRLGFWWDSGTPSLAPRGRGRLGGRLGSWFSRLLPVQSSLLDEFLGRFRGTLRRYWYLTDGGHFENLGGYELIRRRLPLIVLVDSGADPDYQFADLANLIRKARLDFNAEIEFFDPANDDTFKAVSNNIETQFHSIDARYFGTLEQLRPREWTADDIPKHFPQHTTFKKSDTGVKFSLGHAAVARVKYLDEADDERHYLILIKPTLTGDEPEDLTNYQSANPTFPEQTTAEQFFDEAQWESYRRLGQHITECVFGIPVK